MNVNDSTNVFTLPRLLMVTVALMIVWAVEAKGQATFYSLNNGGNLVIDCGGSHRNYRGKLAKIDKFTDAEKSTLKEASDKLAKAQAEFDAVNSKIKTDHGQTHCSPYIECWGGTDVEFEDDYIFTYTWSGQSMGLIGSTN